MANSKQDILDFYKANYPGKSFKNAARQAVVDNKEPHSLPAEFTLTITNANAEVKTAAFLNAAGIDYAGYPNIQVETTAGGLTYTTSYKGGVDKLRDLLVKDHYVIAGYVLNCGSDANADAGQFDIGTFEQVFFKGLVQTTKPLSDQLIASQDKSSFNKQTRAVVDQFVCNTTSDTVIDIIPSGKLVITFLHADKVSGVPARY